MPHPGFALAFALACLVMVHASSGRAGWRRAGCRRSPGCAAPWPARWTCWACSATRPACCWRSCARSRLSGACRCTHCSRCMPRSAQVTESCLKRNLHTLLALHEQMCAGHRALLEEHSAVRVWVRTHSHGSAPRPRAARTLGHSQGFCARQGGAERRGRGGGHRGARGRACRQGLCRGGCGTVAAGGARRPAYGLRQRHGLAPGPAGARSWVRPGGSTCHGDPCAVSSVTRKYSMPPAQDAAATPTVNVFRVAPRLRVPVPARRCAEPSPLPQVEALNGSAQGRKTVGVWLNGSSVVGTKAGWSSLRASQPQTS